MPVLTKTQNKKGIQALIDNFYFEASILKNVKFASEVGK